MQPVSCVSYTCNILSLISARRKFPTFSATTENPFCAAKRDFAPAARKVPFPAAAREQLLHSKREKKRVSSSERDKLNSNKKKGKKLVNNNNDCNRYMHIARVITNSARVVDSVRFPSPPARNESNGEMRFFRCHSVSLANRKRNKRESRTKRAFSCSSIDRENE